MRRWRSAGATTAEQHDASCVSSPRSVASIASHRQWIVSRWTSWMRVGARVRDAEMDVAGGAEVHRCGRRPCRSARRRASRARARPRSPRSRWRELPDVEIASSTSPLAPSARTCFANTCSNEIVVGDRGERATCRSVSAIAGSSGRSRSKRPTSSAAKCCASAAEPPLPQARMLAVGEQALGHDSARARAIGGRDHVGRVELELARCRRSGRGCARR